MTDITKKLGELIETGDEASVRSFIIEHINDFPTNLKNEFIFAFLQEAVELDTKIKEAQVALVSEGLGALREIKKEKKNLLDKQRILELMSKMKE